MNAKTLRRLPLLLICALAPAVLAQTADLKVSLTMPPAAFFNGYGSTAIGTLTVTNAGNIPAQDVTIDFSQLYPTFPYVPYAGWKCNWTGELLRCTVPTVVPGSVSMTAVGSFGTAPAGTVETSSVTISSASTPDPDYTNNTASANTTIALQSDIKFDSLDVPSTVASGKSAAIVANFSNHGPSPATDLSITISIPPGARYEGYVADSRFHCAEPAVGGHGDLVCTSSSPEPVSSDSVEALVSVDPSLAPGATLPLHATLTSTSALQSPLTASGNFTVSAPTAADADVSVTATVDQPSVVAGTWTTETYTLFNAGPRYALDVTLDVRPPYGLAYAAQSNFDVCGGYGPIHCSAAALAPGGTMTLIVRVAASTIGTNTSTAVVTWLNGGPAAVSSNLVVTTRRRATRH